MLLTQLPGQATWWGCGKHVPSVMLSIEESEWCTCAPKTVVDGVRYPPKAGEGRALEPGTPTNADEVEHYSQSLEDDGLGMRT